MSLIRGNVLKILTNVLVVNKMQKALNDSLLDLERLKDRLVDLYSMKDLFDVIEKLQKSLEIVRYEEIIALKKALSEDNMFLFHLGDCSESFDEANLISTRDTYDAIYHKYQELHNSGNFSRVVQVIRGAGQFFKPRSQIYSNINGKETLNYFGDGINGYSPDMRTPNIDRLSRAYEISLAKTTYFRQKAEQGNEMLYSSHECLFTPYEYGLLRSKNGENYASSAHLLWLGYRNFDLDNMQVRFLRRVINPIAIKIGPDTDPKKLLKMLDLLNPYNEKGKIILLFRLGISCIKDKLPLFLKVISTSGANVIFATDPMHGNNRSDKSQKYRLMSEIIEEIKIFKYVIDSYKYADKSGRGISLEFTIDNCYECLEQDDRKQEYLSLCDPRINKEQLNMIVELFTHVNVN
jgi:3-deoxy-7-phosphoheptulonate synthase